MIVLGLWDGHDASASVTVDGRLVAALSEERLTRKKLQRGFPAHAVAEVLQAAELEPEEVDAVALAGRAGRLPMRLFSRSYERRGPGKGPLGPFARALRHYENLSATLPGWRVVETALSLRCVRQRLATCGIAGAVPLYAVRHHAAHAFAAASLLPDATGLVWTMDGYGDGLWATATRWSHGQPKLLTRLSYRSSPAVTYGAVSQMLGFREGEEGKTTALAAHGDPTVTHGYFRDGPVTRGGPLLPHEVLYLRRFPAADVAAGLQLALEERVLQLIEQYAVSSDEAMAFAGGLFANVSVNGRLVERFPDCSIQVFPAMGDGGLSAGAALHTLHRLGQPVPAWKDAYLGPRMERRIDPSRLPEDVQIDRGTVAEISVARLLSEGSVVALVDGRDEFGPRALGNRTLLFPATDPAIAARVAAALGRDPIMPFAPVCRARHVDTLFSPPYPCADQADRGLSSMTVAVRATEETAQRYPVAVHVDGTARVQAITRGRHRILYRILAEYEKRTGHQLLINTSFNLHGEPIVHDASDALVTFQAAGFDGLLLGRRLLTRRDRVL